MCKSIQIYNSTNLQIYKSTNQQICKSTLSKILQKGSFFNGRKGEMQICKWKNRKICSRKAEMQVGHFSPSLSFCVIFFLRYSISFCNLTTFSFLTFVNILLFIMWINITGYYGILHYVMVGCLYLY